MRFKLPRSQRSKWAVVAVVGAVVFSSAYAFAATLGVTSNSLGAGNASVVSCAASVTGSYAVAYDSSLPGYKVSSVTIAGLTTCSGQTLTADLTGTGNASLAQITHTVTAGEATAGTATVSVAGSIGAAGVTGVSVALAG